MRNLITLVVFIITMGGLISPTFAKGTFEELVYFGDNQSPKYISRLVQNVDPKERIMFQLDYSIPSEQIVLGFRGRFRELGNDFIVQPRVLGLFNDGDFKGIKLQTCSVGKISGKKTYVLNSCIFPQNERVSFYNEGGVELTTLMEKPKSSLWIIIEENHKAGAKSHWKMGPELLATINPRLTIKIHHCFGLGDTPNESLVWTFYNF